jgi:hypothetical protein
MSLEVKLLSVDQKVSLSDGEVSNFIDIQLPDGFIIKALITDDAAQRVLILAHSHAGVLKDHEFPRSTPSAYAPMPAQQSVNAFEFGGDVDVPPIEDDEPVVPPKLPPQITRVRQPNVDERGNPIDKNGMSLETQTMPPTTPERPIDEDGVPGL